MFEAEEVPNSFLKIVRRFQDFQGCKKTLRGPRKTLFEAEEVPNSLLKIVQRFQTFEGSKKTLRGPRKTTFEAEMEMKH